MRSAIVFSAAWLMLLASPAGAANVQRHLSERQLSMHQSMVLIALPYLHLLHQSGQKSPLTVLSIDRRQLARDLSNGRWRITLTFTPSYNSRNFVLRTIAADPHAEASLSFPQQLNIPWPLPGGPVAVSPAQAEPLWLQISYLGAQKQAWHAPSLTPAAAALALAEQKRNSALAKRMADRAFYFGYDTNKDALK